MRSAECGNAEWLRRGARYVKIVAEAIHYAHERGHPAPRPQAVQRPHRPVRPAARDDFGLAKRLHHDSELTLSGQVLGSPNYMPPEQAAGQTRLVGRRSDVYSLGAFSIHLLTGAAVRGRDTHRRVALRAEHGTGVAAPAQSSVPRDLETSA